MESIKTDLNVKLDSIVSIINNKIENMQKEFNDKINTVFADFDTRIRDLCKEMETRDEQCSSFNRRLSELEHQMSLNGSMALRINAIERRNNEAELLLTGVPFITSENVPEIIRKLCNKIGIDFNACVMLAFRTGKRKEAPIIVRCSSAATKQYILDKYFKYKSLAASDVGFDCNDRIYLNECLTTYDKALYKLANELRKAGKIHKVSTRNGLVVIKETDHSKFMKINYSALDKYKGNVSGNS